VKTYDRTTSANGVPIVVSGQLFGADTLSGGNYAFTDSNAALGKTVAVSGVTVNDGSNGGNYTVTYAANTTSTIERAVISGVTGLTAASRNYDGTMAATLSASGAGFMGLIAGDSLDIAGADAAFADKHAGVGKTVNITNLTLGGRDAANYRLDSTSATTVADIFPATITEITGISARSKLHDGTAFAALDTSGAVFNGMIAGDELTVASGTGAFGDPSPGRGRAVQITGLSLGGADAGNYVLADTAASTTADIESRAVADTCSALGTASAAVCGVVTPEPNQEPVLIRNDDVQIEIDIATPAAEPVTAPCVATQEEGGMPCGPPDTAL
jgi:hypothetical protein